MNNENNRFEVGLIFTGLLIFIAVMVINFFATVQVWDECRDEGHSFFYCMQLVSK